MKNLIKAIELKAKNEKVNFAKEIAEIKEISEINNWRYKNLLPKGTKKDLILTDKQYLIDRYNKKQDKETAKEIERINFINTANPFNSITISIEWKKSATWGHNPSAEARVEYLDGSCEYFNSGSVSGCGYDKESTAVANALNQSNSLLKALYNLKDKPRNIKKHNRDAFGYGAGYGILPRIEGGVGVSCYDTIFNKIGYKFSKLSSGKSFDVYTIKRHNK